MVLSHDLSAPRSKGLAIGFWAVTALFCLQVGFTAYAQLRLPQVAEAFTHLGFPAYFRVELSWAKLLGVLVLLAPVPARLKEWAYAGFAINLGSCRHRPPLGGRWPAGVGVGGGHRRALGAVVPPLAPPAVHAGERLIARRASASTRSGGSRRSNRGTVLPVPVARSSCVTTGVALSLAFTLTATTTLAAPTARLVYSRAPGAEVVRKRGDAASRGRGARRIRPVLPLGDEDDRRPHGGSGAVGGSSRA